MIEKPSILAKPGPTALFLLFLALIACLMPTRQSFWIDESITGISAAEPGFHSIMDVLQTGKSSEAQMPLFMMSLWIWEKIAGHSEWGLRSLNILWTLLACAAFFPIGRMVKLPLLPGWLIIQPFLWFYANEARPYVMQIAGSSWILYGFLTAIEKRGTGSSWAVGFAAGSVITAGASMLGFFPVAAATAILLVVFIRARHPPSHRAWLYLGIGFLLLSVLGFFYLSTLIRGAGGSKIWESGLSNLAFAFYELTGFLGLGPGRLEIREAARSGAFSLVAVLRPFGFGLGALAGMYLLLVIPFVFSGKRILKPLPMAAISYLGLSTLLLLTASVIVHFSFWGRHLAPMLPVWALLTALAASAFLRTVPNRTVACAVPSLLAILLAASSISIRLHCRHAKEDYREAVRLALDASAQGEKVGWAADPASARYYGICFENQSSIIPIRTRHFNAFNEDMNNFAPPIIILSKPDIFDPNGLLQKWVNEHGYLEDSSLRGFSVWRVNRHAQ